MLLPIIGAGLGGYEGYRRSGGNIGATLLGAGLGAVTPAGLRMAGTALGAKLAGSGLASQAGAGLMGGAARLGQVAANAPGTLQAGLAASGAAQLAKGARILSSPGLSSRLLPGMVGSLAAGTGVTLGAPALAGALASNVAPAAGTAAAGGAGLMYPGVVAEPAQYGGDALPLAWGNLDQLIHMATRLTLCPQPALQLAVGLNMVKRLSSNEMPCARCFPKSSKLPKLVQKLSFNANLLQLVFARTLSLPLTCWSVANKLLNKWASTPLLRLALH
jgi:hypothetical protein